MTKKIYALYDNISKIYSTPIFEINDAKIVRDLKYMINNQKDSEISINAKDKSLVLIGEYNETSGLITPDNKTIIELRLLVDDEQNSKN